MSWFDVRLFAGLYSAFTAAVVAVGLGYFFVWSYLGLRLLRQSEAPDSTTSSANIEDDWDVFVLVPCLNEARVIGATVRALMSAGAGRVLVIDDASDDDTSTIAVQAGGGQVQVLRRELPNARKGKGPALNHGLEAVRAEVAQRGLDPDRVIICVMDADGRLSDGALKHVLPLFDDSRVGGAQVAVQIRRNGRLITRMQDFEFWGLSAISQFGRRSSATVSLGGNGQFTRLSALLSHSTQPWGRCMTEDLELALDLLQAGWRLDTTPKAWVTQQAVDRYRPLIRQRARWFQGHMSCVRHLPGIWRSRQLGGLAVLELSLYLGVPWALVLPWSVMFHVGLAQSLLTYKTEGSGLLGSTLTVQIVSGAVLYLVSFAPILTSGYLYYKRCRGTQAHIGFLRAIGLAHLLILWNYVAYIACWRALFRICRKREVWDKTARSVELPSGRSAAALEPIAASNKVSVLKAGE
ncbi:glycosyltransferase family 2 protein [Streptomyces lavendulocolor]|uniref:glycosyltransferase family 2 protein n=1 Tax=Streptomyces lavendulocolor TaxID=67316 RepID=UPI0033FCF731